jgi:hypothetical protein
MYKKYITAGGYFLTFCSEGYRHIVMNRWVNMHYTIALPLCTCYYIIFFITHPVHTCYSMYVHTYKSLYFIQLVKKGIFHNHCAYLVILLVHVEYRCVENLVLLHMHFLTE